MDRLAPIGGGASVIVWSFEADVMKTAGPVLGSTSASPGSAAVLLRSSPLLTLLSRPQLIPVWTHRVLVSRCGGTKVNPDT